jgi:cyclopropane-fatty-acyl-phospholipid synthase
LFEGSKSKASDVFGADKEGVPVAYLHVHDDKFWVRVALFADMVRIRVAVSQSLAVTRY